MTTITRLRRAALALALLTGTAFAGPANQVPAGKAAESDPPDDSNFLGERSNSNAHDEAIRRNAEESSAGGAFADSRSPGEALALARQLRPDTAPERAVARAADDQGPIVVHRPPAEARAGAPLAIDATVTDPSGVEAVELSYRFAAGAAYETVAMHLAADGQYRARLPPLPLATAAVDYQIVARDRHGNQRVVGTAADPIQMPVRSGSPESRETAPAATGSQVALALPIVLVLGWAYRLRNRASATTGDQGTMTASRPTPTAHRPTRAREQSKLKEVDRAFWRRLLTPLTRLADADRDAAITELSSRPLRHPVYGARQFPAGYLRSKIAEMTIPEPAAVVRAGRSPSNRVAKTEHRHEHELDLDLDLDFGAGELGVEAAWLEPTTEVGDPISLAPTPVEHAEPSCLLNAAVVSANPEELRRIKLMLEEFDLFVETASTATEALDLVYRAPYRLLVVRYPLPDIEVNSFLLAVRQPNSPCLRSSVILLAEGNDRSDAEHCIGRGANRILPLDAPQAELHDAADGLLKIAERKRVRLLARVEPLAGPKDLIMCQTDNVSSTGMLIHTDRRYPLGTACRFEFQLPNDEAPLHGIAEVVRHTAGDRERTGGVGFRFVSFAGTSRARFEQHLLRL